MEICHQSRNGKKDHTKVFRGFSCHTVHLAVLLPDFSGQHEQKIQYSVRTITVLLFVGHNLWLDWLGFVEAAAMQTPRTATEMESTGERGSIKTIAEIFSIVRPIPRGDIMQPTKLTFLRLHRGLEARLGRCCCCSST